MNIVVGFMLTLFMVSCGFAFWGAGSLVWRDSLHGIRIVGGMCLYVLIGGMLNLMGVAFGSFLIFLLLLGVALGIYYQREFLTNFTGGWRPNKDHWLALGVLLFIFLVLSLSVLWPQAYNFHDDLQKYFVHPVKMLGSGSLFGSPLATIGKEVLGGQALLQAPFVYLFGIGAINALDAVFCLVLVSLLVIEVGFMLQRPRVGTAAALLLFVIHPQYVNVSSIYSLVLLIAAAVVVHWYLLVAKTEQRGIASYFVLLGLIYATAMSFKSTNAIFPLVHFPVVATSLLLRSGSPRRCFEHILLAIGAGIIAIVPWIIVPAAMMLEYSAPGSSALRGAVHPDLGRLSFLLSKQELFWGGSPREYFILVLTAIALTTLGLLQSYGRRDKPLPAQLVAGCSLITVVLILVFLVAGLGDSILDLPLSIRYSVPFLIGFAPTALVFTGQAFEWDRSWVTFIAVVVVTCAIAIWVPGRWATFVMSRDCGSVLSFKQTACLDAYQKYNRFVLEGDAKKLVANWQQHVPAGEDVLVWVNFPHLLDFSRNTFFEIDEAGLNNPWARLPDARYFIYQRQGVATESQAQIEQRAQEPGIFVREIFQNVLRFREYLNSSVKVEEVLFQDERVLVLKIAPPEDRSFK